jgi:signal transduction histidine kinase/ActR/RegA family two-component response regulator
MRWAVSPKILENPENAALGLATARQCVNLFVATSCLTGLSWALGLTRVSGLLGGAAGFVLLVLGTLRFAPDIAMVRFTGSVGLLGFPLAIAWTDRAMMPAALPWLVVLPLIGTLIDGWKVGVFFALLSATGIAVTAAGAALGKIPEPLLSPAVTLAFTAGGLTGLVAVVVVVTAYYGTIRTQTLERLASAERDLAHAREQALLGERLASLGTLAAGVAHEINNPMSYVAGNVEAVLRQLRAASRDGSAALDLLECEAALADALTGAGRVRDIVSDLQTFAHKPDEALRPVDVATLFGAVTRIVHNQLRHRALLTVAVEPGLVLEASESRLAQVLVNLLTNAFQAMPERPLAMNKITLHARALDLGLAELEVSDNGEGMSPEVLARAFEPFFTTKPVGLGTGLGLYVCRNLIVAMNGQVSITSEPGRGTRVRVELQRGSGSPVVVPHNSLPPPGARRRVLIVDDEPLVSRALSRMLRGRCDVTTVLTAEDALTALADERFDAVLCDVMMPGRSGASFLRELESRDTALASRVGFITGGAFDQESRDLLERVGDRWIAKPCDTASIEALLDRLAGPTPQAYAGDAP